VTPGERQPADAGELERQFFATRESEERGAIIAELWTLNTKPAVTTLHRLLNADSNVDVKVEIISGLIDAEANPDTEEIRWALLLAGLAANQPAPIRELAAGILAQARDPRTLPLLQSFANDPDEAVREAAQAALSERREIFER
jgi:HEAT repeat protein